MESPGDTVRRGRPMDPYVDDALRTATREIISKSGWRGATVERIAERAGVARTTIYRRHGSVHGIARLLLNEMYSDVAVPDTGSLRGDLIAVTSAVAQLWRSASFADFVFAMLAAQRENAELHQAYIATVATRRREINRIVERAISRGELSAEADGDLLLDLLGGLLLQRNLLDTPVDDDKIPMIVDTLVSAFTARSRSQLSPHPAHPSSE